MVKERVGWGYLKLNAGSRSGVTSEGVGGPGQ